MRYYVHNADIEVRISSWKLIFMPRAFSRVYVTELVERSLSQQAPPFLFRLFLW